METKQTTSEETVEKLKKLLSSINGIKSTKDLFSLCIHQTLHHGIKG